MTSSAISSVKAKQNSYECVDIAKFFFCICIVALHANVPYAMPEPIGVIIEKVVVRLAVPYFFIASGFFLGKKLRQVPANQCFTIIKQYCLRLLRPLIVFEIISLIIHISLQFREGLSLSEICLSTIQSIIFYPHGALWYVQACIVASLLLFPFIKYNKLIWAVISGIILYMFALIANNYYFLIAETPIASIVNQYLTVCISPRNGLFTGFLFLGLGILCSYIHARGLNKKILIGITVCAWLIYVAEIFLLLLNNALWTDDGGLYISHIILVPCLVLLTIEIRLRSFQRISILLRNLSTGVYFLHRPILNLLSLLTASISILFCTSLAISIAICLIVYKTKIKALNMLLK